MKLARELPAEIRARLEAEARRQGTEPDALLVSLVDASLPQSSRPPQADQMGVPAPVDLRTEGEAERFRQWADSHPRRGVPVIPLDALDRESIYGDHA